MGTGTTITVFLADDSVIIREGVRAMLQREADLDVVGVAEDLDGLIQGAIAAAPQVIVSDIRMPPNFQQEGIDGCKEIRKRHPGTGIVILSQYDDPDYAISLLSEGAAGYAYLLKDRIAEGDQLARAIREVATGGSMLDPAIVGALVNPVRSAEALSPEDEALLTMVAEGKPIKAIAATRHTTPAAVADDVERLWVRLAQGVSSGADGALKRLRRLHEAIVEREEQGETLARLLPGGVAEKLRQEGRAIGDTERLDVTVLMSDIRGYSTIAEHADPAALAGAAQHPPGRDEPGHHRRGRHRDAVRRRRRHGRVRRPGPEHRPRRPGPRRRAGHARRAGQGERRLAGRRAGALRVRASASPPARSPRRCSARRSGSSTRSSATP